MKPKVAVLLVNFKGIEDTLCCLDSLAKATKIQKCQVYIANYQVSVNEQKLEQHALRPTVTTYQDNLGFAGFNNQLLIQAKNDGFEQFVLLNNDTEVDTNFLEPLVKKLESGAALVTPKIYFFPGMEYHKVYSIDQLGKVIWYAGGVIDWDAMLLFHRGVDEVDRGHFETACEVEFGTGCCLAFNREVLDLIGLLPESLFMYLEDAVFSLRAKAKGVKVWYEPESIVWHKNAQSSGGVGSRTQLYYQTRNRMWLALRYAPIKTKLAVLRQGWRQGGLERKATIHGLFARMGQWYEH